MLGLGVALKKKTGLPLILDLRDPWSLNFTQRSKPGWYRRWVQRIERRCFEAADTVLFTCDAAADAYRAAYPHLPSGRIQRIYNSYDPALKPADSPQSPNKKTIDIVHFGNCYGPRRLNTVIEAIALLRDRGVADADRLRLVNLGRPAKADLDLLTELGLDDRLTWGPFVSYADGIQILANAAAQLLLAYGDETLYVPAKTFDYFLTGAPILCLTASDELRNMVESTSSGLVSAPRDAERLADHLSAVIEASRAGMAVCTPDTAKVEAYSSPHTASQLAKLLDSLT